MASDDIFRSDINQGQVNFTNPFNPAHLYPGWGGNPAYQTPAYDALYRPAYQGPNPYAGYGRIGAMQGFRQAFLPGYKEPYWGNPVDNMNPAFNAMGSRATDFMAHLGQNYITPIMTGWAAQRMFSGVGTKIGAGFASGITHGVGLGGIDAAAGRGLGALVSPFSSSAGASIAGRGLAGSIGGLFGSFVIPQAIGLASAHAVDTAVFQPFIRARQTGEMTKDSFSGVTFGDGFGNSISGRGLSFGQSARIGASIDRDAIRDMTFSANQYHGIAGMGMRAGLFDDVSGGSGITGRVKDIASQIKMILAISKDPNVQTAIEELSKLRLGGASVSGGAHSVAAGAYSSIGMHASAAGASVQKLMGTVGSQGQYMFQMGGITPYLGQIAAASAYSGFASAQRVGIMPPDVLARMGGLEGATQSSLAAQLAGSSTPYNRMRLYNQFFGGGARNGVTNNVSAFGAATSGNPLEAYGNMTLFGGHMASAQAASEGMLTPEKQAVEYLRSIHRQPGAGGFSAGEVAAVMQGTMGMTPDQVQAYMQLRASQTNGASLSQRLAGFRAQGKEQIMQALSQNNVSDTFFGRIGRAVSSAYKGTVGAVADTFSYGASNLAGDVSDFAASLYSDLQFGMADYNTADRMGNNQVNLKSLMQARRNMVHNGKGYEGNATGLTSVKLLEKLNKAVRSGGPGAVAAQELLNSGFKGDGAKRALANFLKAQPDGESAKMLESLDSSSALFDETAKIASTSGVLERVKSGAPVDSVALTEITGLKGDALSNLRVLDQAASIYASDSVMSMDLDGLLGQSKYAELAGALKGLSPADRMARVKDLAVKNLTSGYYAQAHIANSMNMSEEQVSANPDSFSSDPAVRQAIRDAKGDKSKIRIIMNAEARRLSGGPARNKALLYNSSGTRREYSNVLAAANSVTDSTSRAIRESNSDVNYSLVTAGNTMLQASQNMLQASQAMGGKPGGGSFSDGVSAWKNLLGLDRQSAGN